MSTVTLPVSKAKECFAKLVKNSEELFDRYVITRNGKEAAVVMSAEEYASLLETIDIVSNRKEVKAIAHGIAQARSKKTIPFNQYLNRRLKPQKRREHIQIRPHY